MWRRAVCAFAPCGAHTTDCKLRYTHITPTPVRIALLGFPPLFPEDQVQGILRQCTSYGRSTDRENDTQSRKRNLFQISCRLCGTQRHASHATMHRQTSNFLACVVHVAHFQHVVHVHTRFRWLLFPVLFFFMLSGRGDIERKIRASDHPARTHTRHAHV